MLEGEVLPAGPPGKSPRQFLSLRGVASNHALPFLLAALARLPNPSPKPQFLPLFLPLLCPRATFRFTIISTSLILSSTCSEAVSVLTSPPLLMPASHYLSAPAYLFILSTYHAPKRTHLLHSHVMLHTHTSGLSTSTHLLVLIFLLEHTLPTFTLTSTH